MKMASIMTKEMAVGHHKLNGLPDAQGTSSFVKCAANQIVANALIVCCKFMLEACLTQAPSRLH